MSKRFDGVIEAVRYTPDGKVQLVRVFERFGPAFGDRILLDRQGLIERIKRGKKFVVGERIPGLAGTFEVGASVQLVESRGLPLIVAGAPADDRDTFEGVPLF
jgi:hypothetical protein